MKLLVLLGKLLITASLLFFVLRKLEINLNIPEILYSLPGIKAGILCLSIMSLQNIILSLRLNVLLKIFGYPSPFMACLRISYIGSFFSQTMISFVGGDAVRIWCLTKMSIPRRKAASAILLDRVVGFIVLILLFVTIVPALFNIVSNPTMKFSLIALAILGMVGSVIFMMLGKLPNPAGNKKFIERLSEVISSSRYLYAFNYHVNLTFVLSLINHFLNIFIIYCMSNIYGIEMPFLSAVTIVTPIMLISMLPFSISGWGVRESTMAVGFGLLGYSQEMGLAISIIFGISLIIASLPGVFIFLYERKQKVTSW